MSLYVETHGQGSDLVLIHGWGMHGGVWQPLLRRLTPYFRLHVVDLPGMGYSKPQEHGQLQAYVEAVAAVVPAGADICGWSLGGTIAMRLALLRPDLMRRLVLVGATPCFTNRPASPQETAWTDGVDEHVFRQFASQVAQDYQATLIKFLTLQCMGADNGRATVKQLRESFAARPVPTMESLQRALRILLENDLRAEVGQLRLPALVIHGDRDSLAPVEAGRWLAQHLPAGGLRVIAGASHAPFLSHPEAFTEALLQFLQPASAIA